MEEEKAAKYYDELVRKGGNAAKFKQGLGFGTRTTSVCNSEAYGSLRNFVKEASPGRVAALHKEIRIESIRDKLKKREHNSSRDDAVKKSSDKTVEEHARGKVLDHYESEDGKRKKSGRRRQSSETSEKALVRMESEENVRKRRPRSHSPSNDRNVFRFPSDDDGKAAGQAIQSSRKQRERQGRNSRSLSSDSSGKSSERRKRSRRTGKDNSVSPVDYRRSRPRNTSSSMRRKHSPSRSYEVRRRARSRSRCHGRKSHHTGGNRRERAYSPYESRRSERHRSPSSYSSFYRNHIDSRPTGRPDGRSVESIRRRNEDDRRDERSFGRGSTAKENPPERAYSNSIPNFDSMTPAEKVKAKMKLQLSEIGLRHKDRLFEVPAVAKDQAKGMSEEWERFDFDQSAPLDDDAKLDYFGDGTGASDDTLFLKNTGSTYLSSYNQVKREALVTAAHEAAIFGPPEDLSFTTLELEREAVVGKIGCHGDGACPSDSRAVGTIINFEPKDSKVATPPFNSVVSEQVIAMQQAGSWQERARKIREAQDPALAC